MPKLEIVKIGGKWGIRQETYLTGFKTKKEARDFEREYLDEQRELDAESPRVKAKK